MNINKSTNIVHQFLQQELFSKLNQRIKLKQIQKRMARRVPRIVTKNVLSTLIDSSIKNSNLADGKIMKKVLMQQCYQNKKEPIKTIVPTLKKHSVRQNSELLMPRNDKLTTMNSSYKSESRKSSQSTYLIKLPQIQEDQITEVKQFRKIKQLQQIYEYQKQLNFEQNSKNRQLSINQKKNSLSECIYHHTYDYQTNIMKLDEVQRQNFAQCEQSHSLLQKIKQNLDQQLYNQRMQQKLAKIEQQNKKHIRMVPLHKIEKVQNGLQNVNPKIADKELIQKKLKPQFKFQNSQIKSLSKDIESYLSEGIKLVTHQNKLVEQKHNQGKYYEIKEQRIVKEKERKKKQKTLTSQSLIYTYQKNQNLINHGNSMLENQEKSLNSYKFNGEYKSLQLQNDNKSEIQQAFTERLVKHSKKYTTIQSHNDKNQLHLPALNKYHGKDHFRKRNTTEQKVIKGLDSIQINIRTPNNKALYCGKPREGHSSALDKNKRTQSSLEEMSPHNLNSSRLDSRVKKEALKEYFNNYKQQFRHRIRSISEAIKLYS